MTETGISHTPRNGRSQPGYVGDGIQGVETKLAENGEVLIRGPMNMLGYYKNPEATARGFHGRRLLPDGRSRRARRGRLAEDHRPRQRAVQDKQRQVRVAGPHRETAQRRIGGGKLLRDGRRDDERFRGSYRLTRADHRREAREELERSLQACSIT